MKVFFIIFVAAYAALIVISPNLGPADDYLFLRTIQSGRPLLYYTNPAPGFPIGDYTKFGRFNYLGTTAFNLFGLFSKSPSPFWYYFFSAFQYVVTMILFVKILEKFASNKFLIYLPPILLSLLPNAISWFRLQIADRDLIYYFAIFIFFFLLYLEKQKLYYLILGIITANMAIHYKENGFIALAVFIISYLFLSWKKSRLGVNPVEQRRFAQSNLLSAEPPTDAHAKNNINHASNELSNKLKSPLSYGVKILGGLVVLSSFAYLLLYYFVVYRHLIQNAAAPNYAQFNSLLVSTKNLLNYAFFNDPIIILILLPFTAWRIYKFLRRQVELHPVYDSMLVAASVFVLSYFVLNIYSPNYFLPAYIFALPPLIYFFSQTEQKTLFWKTIMIICVLTLVLNVFPTGIHNITYQKYLPTNFNKTTDFLVEDINVRYPNKRANIFIDAVNPDGGGGIYFIIGEFFQYKGLAWDRFDFKANVKVTDNVIQNIPDFQNHAPFSIFQKDELFEPSKGDYLIITADGSTTKNINSNYIQSLNKDYDLIFRTYSPLAFPNLNLKTLAKYFLSNKLSQSQKEKGVIANENLMQWPDYYVFIHK